MLLEALEGDASLEWAQSAVGLALAREREREIESTRVKARGEGGYVRKIVMHRIQVLPRTYRQVIHSFRACSSTKHNKSQHK